MTIDDEPIFEKLKEFRLSLSKKLKLPAFVIFPDKTLIEMAKFKPETLDELEKIYKSYVKKAENEAGRYVGETQRKARDASEGVYA